MSSGAVDRSAHRPETPALRADRNSNELLQELRVSQTGVQILFAFLLTLGFAQRFEAVDDFQQWMPRVHGAAVASGAQ